MCQLTQIFVLAMVTVREHLTPPGWQEQLFRAREVALSACMLLLKAARSERGKTAARLARLYSDR